MSKCLICITKSLPSVRHASGRIKTNPRGIIKCVTDVHKL